MDAPDDVVKELYFREYVFAMWWHSRPKASGLKEDRHQI